MIELNEPAFDKELKGSKKPAVCFFHTPFCRPCKQMSVILGNLERRFGDAAEFYSVNLEAQPRLSDTAGIMVVPAVIIYKSGRAVERFFGLIPEDAVSEALEAILLG